MSKEVGDEYSSSLADLTMNSKPLINMLTILAEESLEHAAVIVQSVVKHLDKVHPEIKLPVLYLVDSIIKNVGGAYTQLFSQIIVNMFCNVFKQVNEDIRYQMFKLRETWHDVFPSVKLYQLDVKVNLIDPGWPIQAQSPQSNIHVNPNFLKKPDSTTPTQPAVSSVIVKPPVALTSAEEDMRKAVALKEQELLLLQQKKIEMELKRTQRQISERRRALEKTTALTTIPVLVPVPPLSANAVTTKVRQVPVSAISSATRIAPVSPALVNARSRDPRLAARQAELAPPVGPPVPALQTPVPPALLVPPPFRPPALTTIHFDLDKTEVRPRVPKNASGPRVENKVDDGNLDIRHVMQRKDPRRNKNSDITKSSKLVSKRPRSPSKQVNSRPTAVPKRDKTPNSEVKNNIASRVGKLPPIPKIKSRVADDSAPTVEVLSPSKRKKDKSASPKTNGKSKKNKDSSPKATPTTLETKRSPTDSKRSKLKPKYDLMDVDPPEEQQADVTFNQLKSSTKERNYIRRNRDKSESPEPGDVDLRTSEAPGNVPEPAAIVPEVMANGEATRDIDLRVIAEIVPAPVSRKRPSTDELEQSPAKKSKSEKFDALFGNEDVDLRTLSLVKNPSPPPPPMISADGAGGEGDGGWARLKEERTPQATSPATPTSLELVRAKLAEATRGHDRLGRPLLYQPGDTKDRKKDRSRNSEDTDMRKKGNHTTEAMLDGNIKNMLSQAEEQLKTGHIDQDLIVKVLRLNEKKKLKEAKQKELLESSKRKLNWLQKQEKEKELLPLSDEDMDGSSSPGSDMSDIMRKPVINNVVTGAYGDIDERIAPLPLGPVNNISGDSSKRVPLLPRPDHLDSDLRIPPRMPGMSDLPYTPQGPISDGRYSGRPPHNNMGSRMFGNRPWRGGRPRMEEWGGPQHRPPSRGGPPNNWRMPTGGRPPYANMPVLKPIEAGRLPQYTLQRYESDGRPPPHLGSSSSKGFPLVDPKLVEYVTCDTMKTIFIDGVAREIRYYDNKAVVMLDWDNPRDISFQPGQRRIYFDDESFLLNFNEEFVNITIEGEPHKIRFGGPTRELFIDDMWYECNFGGSVPMMLNGKVRQLSLDGPPPQVSIGDDKRTDLVAGKINLIVDGVSMHPVFLDAKPQTFEVENVVHTLRFVDSLQTMLINEKPFKVEFGGLPKPIFVGKRKHFIRFSVLPPNIKAGHIYIVNMEGYQPSSEQDVQDKDKTNKVAPITLSTSNIDTNVSSPAASVEDKNENLPTVQPEVDDSIRGLSGRLDMLASLMPSSMAPASQFGGYSRADSTSESPAPGVIPGLGTDVSVPPPNISSVLQNLNVNDLFAKLVASGIVNPLAPTLNPSVVETTAPVQTTTRASERSLTKNPVNVIKPVNLLQSDTLKVRQPGLIAALHTGMQCGSCGVRFPLEHTVRYSQHLDWHFRQNRADRDSQRRPHSRRWHYDISDWIQYEEIEDLEEREKSWFERQQQAAESENSEAAAAELSLQQQEASSVRAGPAPTDLRCELCRDSFDQFYNEESEEWHLRKAVRHEEKNYHPLCLEEYKASLLEKETSMDITNPDDTFTSEKDTNEDKNENDISKSDDIIDDLPSQEDSIADKDNESDVEVISMSPSEMPTLDEDEPQDVEVLEEDDDVVIKTEPVEQIIVDDVDTDEETEKERAARNNNPDIIPIDFANIKIKQEPIDPDDEPIITAITSEGVITAQADTTHASLLSSIDGNVQLEPTIQTAPVIPVGGIRINITKPLVSQQAKEVAPPSLEVENSDEPLPPGEEPEIEFKVKPSLEGVVFSMQPPSNRGSELSALCSIM